MLLKHDCLKKKKKEHIQVWYIEQRDEACKRSTDIFFLKTKQNKTKQNQSENSSLFRSSIQGPSRLANEGKLMPLPLVWAWPGWGVHGTAATPARPGPHLRQSPRAPGLVPGSTHHTHWPDAAQRDFTPTRTTVRTMMMTSNIRITSIFRFFFWYCSALWSCFKPSSVLIQDCSTL